MLQTMSLISTSLPISLSDIIAIIALFLSALSTFIVLYRERFALSVECTKILINFDNQFSPPAFKLMILNRSTLPISIKKIEFCAKNHTFTFDPIPGIIYNDQQDATRHLIFVKKKTSGFPVIINGLSAFSAFFKNQKACSMSTKELRELSGRFILYTSRRKRYKTKPLKLSEIQLIICDLESRTIKYNSHPE